MLLDSERVVPFVCALPCLTFLTHYRIFIPLDKLTCENAFYWRCLCEHIRSLGTAEEDHLDKILPSGVVFAQYLRR